MNSIRLDLNQGPVDKRYLEIFDESVREWFIRKIEDAWLAYKDTHRSYD